MALLRIYGSIEWEKILFSKIIAKVNETATNRFCLGYETKKKIRKFQESNRNICMNNAFNVSSSFFYNRLYAIVRLLWNHIVSVCEREEEEEINVGDWGT